MNLETESLFCSLMVCILGQVIPNPLVTHSSLAMTLQSVMCHNKYWSTRQTCLFVHGMPVLGGQETYIPYTLCFKPSSWHPAGVHSMQPDGTQQSPWNTLSPMLSCFQ